MEAIIARLDDELTELFAAQEAELVPYLIPLTVAGVSRAMGAWVHRVVTSGRSAILDYGIATRTIPAPLWNSLVIRDECCRFPGCDRPSVWCEGHHVVWVTHGGTT
ncbi:MAG TPA: hypothetical protein VNT52_13580, partial [Acidimicrobiales bacterium]|nr:hypothetical protein [Acidimicrobiales bacterium]